MSIHIAAQEGQIAEVVLFPGDPLRAQYIAETFLENVTRYNTVRNMFGFTGTYKGVPVSVQGSGMGIPSAMIYAEELYQSYGVKTIIRIGTAGGMKESVKVRDIVFGQGATTELPKENIHVGNILSSDRFYNEEMDKGKLARYGVLAVEMEAAGLYAVAAKHNRQALAMCTISDHLITGEETTAEERQTTFTQMMEVALETAYALQSK